MKPKLVLTLIGAILMVTSALAQTGATIWLKADQLSEDGTFWQDVSGKEHHATSNNEISTHQLNFHPAAKLDGGSHYEVMYNIDSLVDLTCFSVFQVDNDREKLVWSSMGTVSNHVVASTHKTVGPDSAYDVYKLVPNRLTNSTLVQRWEKPLEAGEDATILIGGSGTSTDLENFEGYFSEFILFDRALTFLERMQIETYLAVKYGISKTQGNYVSSKQQVLWNRKNLEDFNHNIVGIGRDDQYGLYQKQSISASDTLGFLLLSAGTSAETNALNTAEIPDGNFLLIGNNNGSFTMNVDNEETKLPILDRKWVSVPTGDVSSDIKTSLQFDLTRLPFDSAGYWLAVDPTGTGYDPDNFIFYKPDSISTDSIAFFNDIRWDKDGSSMDGFTFASYQPLFVQAKDIKKAQCTESGTGEVSFLVAEGKGPFRYRVLGNTSEYDHYFDGGKNVRETGLIAGSYRLIVTDANGSMFERSFEIGLEDAIEVHIPEKEIQLSKDSLLTLNAFDYVADSVEASYQWSNNFGFTSTGPEIAVEESGIYTLTVTNSQGCTFSDQVVVSGSPFQKIAVYPTISATGYYSVNVSLDHADKVVVKLYNLKANEKSEQVLKGASEYRVEGYLPSAGLYFLTIETPEGTVTQKLIRR